VIVLDEHLKGWRLDDAIRRWYRGRVCFIDDLRPGSIVKDEAIPALLLTASQPTFVTVNSLHFWQRVAAHRGFCLVCFTLPTGRIDEIPVRLRRLFRLAGFKTKAVRMGKVARISEEQVAYYQVQDTQVHLAPLP
jgi:hypothetical protein